MNRTDDCDWGCSCAACGSTASHLYVREGAILVVECDDCRHIYTAKFTGEQEIMARYAQSGDWLKSDHRQRGSDLRFRTYARRLTEVHAQPGRILDVGCSKGYFLELMRRKGWDCYGVEPSRDAVVAEETIGPGHVWHSAYDSILPLTFDVLTMFEVLEHAPDPRHLVRLAHEQLRPGGHLMGSLPNAAFARVKVLPRRLLGMKQLLVPLTLDPGNHLNYFSSDGLGRMLNGFGLEVLWVRNAPPDYNYLSKPASAAAKHVWAWLAAAVAKAGGRPVASNLWFLARKP